MIQTNDIKIALILITIISAFGIWFIEKISGKEEKKSSMNSN